MGSRVDSPTIWRAVIGSFGGCFLAVAAVLATGTVTPEMALGDRFVTVVLVLSPAFGLLFAGLRLPDSEIHPAYYRTIANWAVVGLVGTATVLVLYALQRGNGLSSPQQLVPIVLSLGSFAGLTVGVYDARARTRTRQLQRRNRELERTRRELEETVEELRTSNERLEQFAYAASHDLQEPLRMVSSYLQLLESRYGEELDDDAEEFLEFAVDGADRMRTMIDGLLEYSRVETSGNPLEPVDLSDIIEDVRADLTLQLERTDADLHVEDLPRVRGDASQLRGVFQNLMENAIRYAGDEPPQIRVRAERVGDEDAVHESGTDVVRENGPGVESEGDAGGHDAAARDEAERSLEEDAWKISVEDQGVGIHPDDMERIFEVFQRLHSREEHDGTGLGLSLCERIVERHGGDIWVESTPGEGSTFSFTLPPVPAEDEADAPADVGDESPEPGDGGEEAPGPDDDGGEGDERRVDPSIAAGSE